MLQHETSFVQLGDAKLTASRVGIGTWAIGGGWGPQPEEESLRALSTALEFGCQLIDTAPLYGNGRAERLIARAFNSYGSRVTTLTKVYPLNYQWAPAPGTPISRIFPAGHIIAQAEDSLRRLEADTLDCLMLQTWCPSWSEETEWYETMLKLRHQGRIRAFGIAVSDHRAEEANGVIAARRVDIIEVPYSILDQRAAERLFPLALQHQISVIARSPLASGALTGTWYEGMKFHRSDWRRRVFRGELLEQTLRRVERIKQVVDSRAPLAQTALRFCLSHPAVSAVIPGVRDAQQAQENMATLQQVSLSQDIIHRLTELWNEDFCYNVRTSIGEEGEGERRATQEEAKRG